MLYRQLWRLFIRKSTISIGVGIGRLCGSDASDLAAACFIISVFVQYRSIVDADIAPGVAALFCLVASRARLLSFSLALGVLSFGMVLILVGLRQIE